MIKIIWAMDQNYLIGKDNKLPWKIPAEMKYFSQTTSNNSVLMGARTFDCIVECIGKPLKNRYNIVITRNKKKYEKWKDKNLVFTDDLLEVLKSYKGNPDKNLFVIGGSKIYQQTYSYADYYYVSVIKEDYRGNIYFRFQDWNKGKLVKKTEFPKFVAYIYQNLCPKEIII